jgi:hypothetical protein
VLAPCVGEISAHLKPVKGRLFARSTTAGPPSLPFAGLEGRLRNAISSIRPEGPCVDGSWLSRIGARRSLVLAAMCSALVAVHMTAGHYAFRGPGPGQFPALRCAVALVGCPDHRFDRICITCCQPFPTIASRAIAHDLVRLSLPTHRASATGSLYVWPEAIMAQAILASLFASATAAIFVGRRSRSLASHGRCSVPCCFAYLMTASAPAANRLLR